MQRYKLIFFVPRATPEAVKGAIFGVGAGALPAGKHSHCCFESAGTKQFKPIAEKGANPTIGHPKGDGSNEYRVERVQEVKCE